MNIDEPLGPIAARNCSSDTAVQKDGVLKHTLHRIDASHWPPGFVVAKSFKICSVLTVRPVSVIALM